MEHFLEHPGCFADVYAHEWKYREAQRSQVGARLARLFADDAATPAVSQQRQPLEFSAAP